jgi:outer membrane cobalamin receptor
LRITIVYIILFFISHWLYATSEESIADTLQLKEVVISSFYKKPENLFAVKTDSVFYKDKHNLATLLPYIAPFNIRSMAGDISSSVSFRGMSAAHTRFLWNGVPLNSSMNGQCDASLLPLNQNDEIIFVKGGNSLLYDGGGFGGVITMDSKPVWGSRFNANFNQSYGSFSTFHSAGQVQFASNRFISNTRVFRTSSSNNYSYLNYMGNNPEVKKMDNAAYQRLSLVENIHFRVNHSIIGAVNFMVQQTDMGVPMLMSFSGIKRVEYMESAAAIVSVKLSQYIGKFEWGVNSGLNMAELAYVRAFPDIAYLSDSSLSDEKSFYNAAYLNYSLTPKTKVTFKFNADLQEVNNHNIPRYQYYKANRIITGFDFGFFSSPLKRTTFYYFQKLQQVNGVFLPLLPSFGTSYALLKQQNLKIKGLIARNYYLPGLNDLFWVPGGNPDLKPEDGLQYDFGVDYETLYKRFNFKIEQSFFYATVNNKILWMPSSSSAGYFVAQNLKDVESYGWEINVKMKYIYNAVTIETGGYYSYTISQNKTALNEQDLSLKKQLPYVPIHLSSVWFEMKYKKYFIKPDLFFTGKRYTDSGNSTGIVLNEYMLTNLSVGKNFNFDKSHYRLYVQVFNVLNVNYQSYLWRPMPQRYFMVGVSLNL